MGKMKAVILAGGFGTRMAEYTEAIPKPMVTIGDKPILIHIMDHYAKFGVTDFVIAAGYKSEIIKKFFLDFPLTNTDFRINTATGITERLGSTPSRNWTVTVVDTGLESMTGGRLLRLRPYIGDETFLLTYGDGLSNVDIQNVVNAHKVERNLVTVTAVRPAARFGELELDGKRVKAFKEKPQLQQGWINGGFFVVEPSFLGYISGDDSVLEKAPLEKVASDGLLGAHLHDGFWQCMDTKRDRDYLDQLWESQTAPWA
jgi:glucose-1-phosphate cytidylyltransferase